MLKTSLRYRISKIVYVVLLEVSLVVDIIFALFMYEAIRDWLGSSPVLALASFLLASTLGATLYLVYIWQMEYLTRGKH